MAYESHTFPQTGDPSDGENFAQLVGQDHNLDYVEEGYDLNLNGTQLSVGQGVCFVSSPSGIGPTLGRQVHSLGYVIQTDQYNLDISGLGPDVYVFVEPRVDTDDDPTVSAYDSKNPNVSDEALLIGYANPNTDDTQEKNRNPPGGDEDVVIVDKLLAPPIVPEEDDLSTLPTAAELGYDDRSSLAYARLEGALYVYNPSASRWDRLALHPHGQEAHDDEVTTGPDTYVSVTEPSDDSQGTTWIKPITNGGTALWTDTVASRMVLYNGTIYATAPGSEPNGTPRLRALTLDGEVLWEKDYSYIDNVKSGDFFRPVAVDSKTGTVTIAQYSNESGMTPPTDTNIIICNIKDGSVRKTLNLANFSSYLKPTGNQDNHQITKLEANNGLLLVTTRLYSVHVFDIESGNQLWEVRHDSNNSGAFNGKATIDGNHVYTMGVENNERVVKMYDRSSGAQQDYITIPDVINVNTKRGSAFTTHEGTLFASGFYLKGNPNDDLWMLAAEPDGNTLTKTWDTVFPNESVANSQADRIEHLDVEGDTIYATMRDKYAYTFSTQDGSVDEKLITESQLPSGDWPKDTSEMLATRYGVYLGAGRWTVDSQITVNVSPHAVYISDGSDWIFHDFATVSA